MSYLHGSCSIGLRNFQPLGPGDGEELGFGVEVIKDMLVLALWTPDEFPIVANDGALSVTWECVDTMEVECKIARRRGGRGERAGDAGKCISGGRPLRGQVLRRVARRGGSEGVSDVAFYAEFGFGVFFWQLIYRLVVCKSYSLITCTLPLPRARGTSGGRLRPVSPPPASSSSSSGSSAASWRRSRRRLRPPGPAW